MSTSDGVQKRNAFAACAAFRIEGLEPSLDHAREFAVREELSGVTIGPRQRCRMVTTTIERGDRTITRTERRCD
jgi:hypothetical protein